MSLHRGQKIGNYEIRALLGKGGMGTVYAAEHSVIRRQVAIKVLRPDLAERENPRTRFFNEARAAAAIHHPHIVEILDVGQREDGLAYIVMELLKGESVRKLIDREKRLTVDDAVPLIGQAASALAAAHAAGIVHRDLKPDNLFLTPATDGGWHLKILDFGIAKLHPTLSDEGPHTNTGTVLGTPQYMPPEQCRGRSGDIDHRADIYSLGIILFEMLCGKPPFVAEGFGEMMMMQVNTPAPSPAALAPDIPWHVETVILKALAKNPADRFQSMTEMRWALLHGASNTLPLAAVGEAETPDPLSEAAFKTPSTRPATTFGHAAGVAADLVGQDLGSTVSARRRPTLVTGLVAISALAIAALLMFSGSHGQQVSAAAGVPAPLHAAPPEAAPVAAVHEAPVEADDPGPGPRPLLPMRKSGPARRAVLTAPRATAAAPAAPAAPPAPAKARIKLERL